MSQQDLKLDLSDIDEAWARGSLPEAVNIDPDNVAKDVSKLVLSLAEFLRQLMEAQAVRRMDAGSLTEEEEDKLGSALMEARDQIRKIAGQFDLTEEDLRLDLGPLGRVV
ncbi:MAG: gas vesicle protein K [Parvularculaceae bacterium]|nr:gas vesicle protein K [Parvularculaceae bacterium]